MSEKYWTEVALKWVYGITAGVIVASITAWLSFIYSGLSMAQSVNSIQDQKIATLEECARSIKESLLRIEVKVDKTDNKLEKLYELRIRNTLG